MIITNEDNETMTSSTYFNTDGGVGEDSDAGLDKVSGESSEASTASTATAKPNTAIFNGTHLRMISMSDYWFNQRMTSRQQQ